jgi:hypothetical protein
MTTLDNIGNTKLVLEDNKIIAIYENIKLYLSAYKINLEGDDYLTHKQTNSIHYFQDPWTAGIHPGVSSEKHYSEVVNGELLYIVGFIGGYWLYPERSSYIQPIDKPSTYLGYVISLSTGKATHSIRQNHKTGLFYYRLLEPENYIQPNDVPPNSPDYGGYSAIWGDPDGFESANYLDFESNFKEVLEPTSEVIETDNTKGDEEEITENIGDKNTSPIINSDIINKITRTISITTQIYFGKSSDYNFYNLGEDRYALKTDSGYDEITGVINLQFSDKTLNLEKDIAGTFDQITGLNTPSGEMFRLYNAAFARFPDADGLKYWIDQFSSGRNTRRVVAQSFLGSAEFIEKYGSNVSDETYVNNLYKNVLGRDADTKGLNYWVGNLSSGIETRYEALLGFSESAENKALFTEMTGFG